MLTVADIETSVEFYARVLGMEPVTFAAGRSALIFGSSKINLHKAGHEFEPNARHPTTGSADLCLIAVDPLEQVIAELAAPRRHRNVNRRPRDPSGSYAASVTLSPLSG